MNRKKNLIETGNCLLVGGSLFTMVVILWPLFMGLSQVPGEIPQQITSISENPKLYIINFIIASLIAPTLSFILLTVALFIKAKKETTILNYFGTFLLTPYLVLTSISYSSQFTILQGFLIEGKVSEASLWYFGNSASIPYFLNQLGYIFFAFSALFIGFKLISEHGLLKAMGILLWVSGLLSIIAFMGLVLRSEIINFATILSGLLTFPIGIISMILGIRFRKEGGKNYV